ncbi:hypothetical protein HID58_048419 [Brassica napus]|uniref:Uncharacterized protein n=1 Tax=Brassica napus TaxID=3708 RepID=A0ABQ8B3L6_BRANA|nr:hypothetical protein HID58_048419 [Brassica napus]
MNSGKTCPGSSRKARHKAILALLVAYLRGKIAILHSREWPRINGTVQLVVPPSPFGMDTTAHRKQHVPEFYSGTKSQLDEHAERPPLQKSRYNPETRQEATATSKPQGESSMLNAIRRRRKSYMLNLTLCDSDVLP